MATTVREQISAVLSGAVAYEPGLDALTVTPPSEADPVLVTVLHDTCAALWRGGWQPTELHRVVGRRGDPTHPHLVIDAIAAHLRRFARTAVDERWLAQADALGARVWWRIDATYLHEFGVRFRLDRVAVLDLVLTLLRVLSDLPPIEVLIPPPGAAASATRGGRRDGAARADAGVLDRVRALLAKAESTTYPPEAEAYTAKAQQLVARHSLDEALLVARSGDPTVVPFARRLGVDHPYEAEKASMLDAVARANRCHAVWSPEFGFATVFGFEADLDAVDLLYTSLLVQAHRAMAQTEPPGGKAGRSRLKTFRQSFLVAYAVRIGERLAGAVEATLSEATLSEAALFDATLSEVAGRAGAAGPAGPGDRTEAVDLLPVLASRDAQIRETMRAVFPRTVRVRGSRVDSREGWNSGRAAANRAVLHAPAGGGRSPS